MKILKIILFTLTFVLLIIPIYGQESVTAPERTPEQEAVKQTEKLQNELRLSTQQAKQVHEINLKYARERQNSNSRSEALQRLKKKYDELKTVLSNDQFSRLQNKQYERSSFQSPDLNRTSSTSSRSTVQQNSNEFAKPKPNTRENSSNERPVRRDEKSYYEQNTRSTIQSARTINSQPNTSAGTRNQTESPIRRTETPRVESRENTSSPRSAEPNKSSSRR